MSIFGNSGNGGFGAGVQQGRAQGAEGRAIGANRRANEAEQNAQKFAKNYKELKKQFKEFREETNRQIDTMKEANDNLANQRDARQATMEELSNKYNISWEEIKQIYFKHLNN